MKREDRCQPDLCGLSIHRDVIRKRPCIHRVTGQEPHAPAGPEDDLSYQEREARKISPVSWRSRFSTQEVITPSPEGLLLRRKPEKTVTRGPNQREEKEDAIPSDF